MDKLTDAQLAALAELSAAEIATATVVLRQLPAADCNMWCRHLSQQVLDS
jgi:hypothetical protein